MEIFLDLEIMCFCGSRGDYNYTDYRRSFSSLFLSRLTDQPVDLAATYNSRLVHLYDIIALCKRDA